MAVLSMIQNRFCHHADAAVADDNSTTIEAECDDDDPTASMEELPNGNPE